MRPLLATLIALTVTATLLPASAQAPDNRAKAQALLENGVSLLKGGSADTAEPVLQQAATLDPENALIQFYLGTAQMNLRRFPQAAESLEKSLLLDDAEPALGKKHRREAADTLGLAYAFQKEFAKAKEVYRKAIGADPDYPGFFYNLACVCSLGGDRKGALDALRRALEVDARRSGDSTLPDPSADEDLKGLLGDPVFHAILIMNVGPQPNDGPGAELGRKGARLLAAGDAAGAAEAERAALEKEPGDARAWLFLAGALDALDEPRKAAEAFGKAVASSKPPWVLPKPVLRFANQRIGRSDLAAGDAEGAARAFRAAIEVDAFHPAAYYGLARASAGLGDKAAAVSALKKAFSLRENLSPVDEPLPDPSKDTAFKKWADDKEWKDVLASIP